MASNAAIIDLGATTRDTDTGLEWLDMSFSLGLRIPGPAGSIACLRDPNFRTCPTFEFTGVGGGWTVAEFFEVDEFVTNITGIPNTGAGPVQAEYLGITDTVAALLGYTNSLGDVDRVSGFTTLRSGRNEYSLFEGQMEGGQPADWRGVDSFSQSSKPDFGIWLFRRFSAPQPNPTPVPEPGSLALLCIGLAGIALSRRRRANPNIWK